MDEQQKHWQPILIYPPLKSLSILSVRLHKNEHLAGIEWDDFLDFSQRSRVGVLNDSMPDSEPSPALNPINPSLGIGDLTNHKTESAILSGTQTRQESRLTLVDLSLKNSVYWCLSAVQNKIASDVRSCLFCAMTSKEEVMIRSNAAWTEVLQRSVATQ